MKYCREITEQIATLLREGSNRTDACTMADISYDTFMKWMEKPEFIEAIKKAEADFKNSNISIIKKAAITHWQAAAWLLERKYQLEYAVKREDSFANEVIPKKMADRAAELLKKLEVDRGTAKPVHA